MAFLINITSTAYISGLSKSVNLYNLKGQFLRSDACLPSCKWMIMETFCSCYHHLKQINLCKTTAKEEDIQYLSKESDILFCSITPSNFGQLSKPGTDLKSACPEDSKTVPES